MRKNRKSVKEVLIPVVSENFELNGEAKLIKSKKEKKIRLQIILKKLLLNVKLKENQEILSKKITTNTINWVYGPAGTSKTYTTCYTLLKLLLEGKIEKIIFTKPVKESGENLGFLPGDVNQKLEPYIESFLYTCKEMVGEENLKFLIDNELIESRALAFMRGITFKNCGLFLDECQNVTYDQLILYMTRLGENSKMILSGDITQRDIEKKKVIFHEFIELYRDLNNIAVHEFTRQDIVRNPLLIEITDRYEKWKELKGI